MYKIIVLLVTVAYASAGLTGSNATVTYSAAPAVSHISYTFPLVSYGTPTLTSQHQNILRSPGNLQQISTYSKTIDTPFSSVSKSDVRVSNPGLAVAAAPTLAVAPVLRTAPFYSAVRAAPIVPAVPTPIVAKAGLLGTVYSAAPVVSHMSYSSGLIQYSY